MPSDDLKSPRLQALTRIQNSVYIFRKSAMDSSFQGDLGRSMFKKRCWEGCLWLFGCAAGGSMKPCSTAFAASDCGRKASCPGSSSLSLAANAEIQFLFQPTSSFCHCAPHMRENTVLVTSDRFPFCFKWNVYYNLQSPVLLSWCTRAGE